MLELVKKFMRITDTEYDTIIQKYIDAALMDLGIAGVDGYAEDDQLVLIAVSTYCRMHFGTPPDYAQLKASYDEQKMQLQTASGYNGRDAGAAC